MIQAQVKRKTKDIDLHWGKKKKKNFQVSRNSHENQFTLSCKHGGVEDI